MLDRFNRNDIIDKERNVISPSLLAKKNPGCRAHVYEIDRMTLKKDDKIVITGGLTNGISGNTNVIKIETI